MATCFSGMGVTPIKDSRDQEHDNTSEGESSRGGPFQANT